MAMIECPECGKAISTLAKNCIHCGYEFTVCPECSAVLEAHPKACPECGFVLASNDTPEKETPKTVENATEDTEPKEKKEENILDLCKKYDEDKKASRSKKARVFTILCDVGSLVLGICGISFGRNVMIFFAIQLGLIQTIINFVTEAGVFQWVAEWIKAREADVEGQIRRALFLDYRKMEPSTAKQIGEGVKELGVALWYSKDPLALHRRKRSVAGACVSMCLGEMFLGIALLTSARQIRNLFSGDGEFWNKILGILQNPVFMIFLCIGIALLIIASSLETKSNKKAAKQHKVWAKQYFGDDYAKYDGMDAVIEQAVDRQTARDLSDRNI